MRTWGFSLSWLKIAQEVATRSWNIMVDATRGWDIMLDARIHAGVHALRSLGSNQFLVESVSKVIPRLMNSQLTLFWKVKQAVITFGAVSIIEVTGLLYPHFLSSHPALPENEKTDIQHLTYHIISWSSCLPAYHRW